MGTLRLRLALALLACVLGSGVALAATGSITVTVFDENNEPLFGAVVQLTHASGQFPATVLQTDANGQAKFPVVQAGTGYIIQASMPGAYAEVRRDGIPVGAGKDSEIQIALTPEIVETVDVIGREDVIDLDEGSTSTTSISEEFFEDLPVLGREYQNALELAPGINDSDGDGNPNVHGSRDRDFKMMVDGVGNVDPLSGQFMSFVNPDSIEEIEIIDSGADASFGGAVGGFGRIITKSGGNQFEGSFNLLFRDDVFDNDGAGGDPIADFGLVQPSVSGSGPIIKDKFWFASSYQDIDFQLPVNLVTGQDFVQDVQAQRPWTKLTLQATPRNKVALQYQADPVEVSLAATSSLFPEEANVNLENGGPTIDFKWTAPYSSRFFWEAIVATRNSTYEERAADPTATNSCVNVPNPDTSDFDDLQCARTQLGGLREGGWFREDDRDTSIWTYRVDAEQFVNEFAGGSHQIKFGFELNRNRVDTHTFREDLLTRGGISTFGGVTGGGLGSGQGAQLSRTVFAPKVDPADPASRSFVDSDARSNNLAVWIQDTYRPLSNLTINLGARVSREEIAAEGFTPFNPRDELANYRQFLDECKAANPNATPNACLTFLGGIEEFTVHRLDFPVIDPNSGSIRGCSFVQVINRWQCTQIEGAVQNGGDLRLRGREPINISNTNVAPRFSIAWDPWNDAKTNVSFGWNRFFGNTFLQPMQSENGPDTAVKVFELLFDDRIGSPTNGGFSAFTVNLVDRNLEQQYSDQWDISVEREIAPETSLRVRYLNRKTENLLQDIDLNHQGVPFDSLPARLPDGRRSTECNQIGQFADCYGAQTRDLITGQTRNLPDGFADLQPLSPFYNDVYFVSNFNSSEYDAWILELTRRFYQNWEFTGSYTWSKAVGDADDYNQALGDDATTVADERGFLSFDQRHIVRLNGRVLVPSFGGIRLGGRFRYETGLPFSIIETSVRDDFPQDYGIGASGTNYNTRGAFRFGFANNRTFFPTGQRNDQRNEPIWNFDVNVQKEFLIKDLNATVQFEIFNLLNDQSQITASVNRVRVLDSTGRFVTLDFPNSFRQFGRQFQASFKLNF